MRFVGLANYVQVLTSHEFWLAMGRTVYFTFISVGVETFLGLMIALLLNENLIGNWLLRSLIILPWAIPTIVNGSIWKWIYHSQYGVLNAVLTQTHILSQYQTWLSSPWLAMNMVIIADVWKMTPLSTLFFLAALQMVNHSVYEAALVDGAGMMSRFWNITIPYLKPTILVVLVMRTMEKLKAFDIFYMITGGGPANGTKVLMYEAYQKAFSNLQYSIASTICVSHRNHDGNTYRSLYESS